MAAVTADAEASPAAFSTTGGAQIRQPASAVAVATEVLSVPGADRSNPAWSAVSSRAIIPSDLDLRSLRIGVLLNTSSGSCDVSTRGATLSVLETAKVEPVQVWDVVGKGVDRALDEATESGLDVLIVLGGDGTIRAAAQRCESGGPLLMPLPGGTMNMLPKALYGARTWREALTDTLAAPIVQAVHGGQVGSHRFYVAGVFGGASLFAEAREAIRDGDLPAAWEQGVAALKQALGAELGYRFEGQSASKAEAVVVLCPLPPQSRTPADPVGDPMPGNASAAQAAGAPNPPRAVPTDNALVRTHSPSIGPVAAKVTIVEFFDPACEACRAFYPIVKQTMAQYPGNVRLVLRYAPLHQGSDEAVRILETARLQNRFIPVLEALLERQPEWAAHGSMDLERAWTIAGDAGLDLKKARQASLGARITAVLNQDIQDLKTVGVSQTPTFFVNGKPLQEFGVAQFQNLVRGEIAAAR